MLNSVYFGNESISNKNLGIEKLVPGAQMKLIITYI